MKSQVLMVLVLVFAVSAGFAAEQPRVQSEVLSPTVITLPRVPNPGCEVGNLVDPVFNYGNWIMGGEKYAYLIDPINEGCSCEEGFVLETVYMRMQFGPEDVPATFDARGSLAEAVWDPTRGVYVPGEIYCSGPLWSITADVAGLYDIFVDLEGGCGCAANSEPYFILFQLPNGFVWWPDAMEDDTPEVGLSWYDSGNGWMDLVADFGWWGNNIMHADVNCCTDPVSSEETPFGQLKSYYR